MSTKSSCQVKVNKREEVTTMITITKMKNHSESIMLLFFGAVLCEFFLGDGAFSRTFNLLLNEPQDSRSNLLAVTSPRNHIQS